MGAGASATSSAAGGGDAYLAVVQHPDSEVKLKVAEIIDSALAGREAEFGLSSSDGGACAQRKALTEHLTKSIMEKAPEIVGALGDSEAVPAAAAAETGDGSTAVVASAGPAPPPTGGLDAWWQKPVHELATVAPATYSPGQKERHRIYAHLCGAIVWSQFNHRKYGDQEYDPTYCGAMDKDPVKSYLVRS